MTDTSKAWVWSQYRAVAPENEASAEPLPLFGSSPSDAGEASGGRTRRGAFLAMVMIIGLFFPKIAFLLLLLSVLMILSGLEPKRFEDFMQTVPGGALVLRVVEVADSLLR